MYRISAPPYPVVSLSETSSPPVPLSEKSSPPVPLSEKSSPPVPLSEKSSPPVPPLREVLTPRPPLRSGEGGLSPSPSLGGPREGYPPAIPPMTRKGSAPEATASGRGASGGSWVRSRSHAKNRRNGRRCSVTWSRIVPRSMG